MDVSKVEAISSEITSQNKLVLRNNKVTTSKWFKQDTTLKCLIVLGKRDNNGGGGGVIKTLSKW